MAWNYPTVVYLSREDFPRMLEAEAPLRSQIAVRLGMKAGLRPIEIRQVTPMDVDAERRQIHVHYCTRSKPRTVPVDRETLDLIEEGHYYEDPGAPIIRPECGYEMRSGNVLSEALLCLMVKKTARAAGLPNWNRYYPYLLRHFFAADWVMRKGNLFTLSRILGHRSLLTTTTYLSRLVFWENHLAEYDQIKGGTRKMSEAGLFIWQVTYRAPQPNGKGTVLVVDFIRADDMDIALKKAQELADTRNWILEAVMKAPG